MGRLKVSNFLVGVATSEIYMYRCISVLVDVLTSTDGKWQNQDSPTQILRNFQVLAFNIPLYSKVGIKLKSYV